MYIIKRLGYNWLVTSVKDITFEYVQEINKNKNITLDACPD